MGDTSPSDDREMSSELDVAREQLSEQPLTIQEKQLLSEYFQLEGKRQFDNYRTLLTLQQGRAPSNLFRYLNLPMETLQELSEKELSLELSQRDHWVNLMESIHQQFYDVRPDLREIELWSLIGMEKHSLVELEAGQSEYKHLLRFSQQRQMELLPRLGERRVKQFSRNLDLFYTLLNIEGLNKNLILFS